MILLVWGFCILFRIRMMRTTGNKYNSTINVVGGIPDYSLMIEHIGMSYPARRISEADAEEGNGDGSRFTFRTSKSTSRFRKAVSDGFMTFASDEHRRTFLEAIGSKEYSNEEKLIILFWQFAYCNLLFAEVTEHVYLRALYAGRTCIGAPDVEAYIKHLKAQEPEEIQWSDNTIKTTASKYLTTLKKFGLADGKTQKEIRAPHISSNLFRYLVRFALTAYPGQNDLGNPMFRYSFLDQESIITRLKAIDCIPLWEITQIGNEVNITLK